MNLNHELEVSDKPIEADIKVLESGLTESLPKNVESRDYKHLSIFIRNENGKIIAGLEGGTYWQWLNIRLLWVANKLRGNGIGNRLVQRAEEIAKNRGCHASVVDTFSFQAQIFYEKLGYVVFGTLKNFPKGHQRIYLSKTL